MKKKNSNNFSIENCFHNFQNCNTYSFFGEFKLHLKVTNRKFKNYYLLKNYIKQTHTAKIVSKIKKVKILTLRELCEHCSALLLAVLLSTQIFLTVYISTFLKLHCGLFPPGKTLNFILAFIIIGFSTVIYLNNKALVNKRKINLMKQSIYKNKNIHGRMLFE